MDKKFSAASNYLVSFNTIALVPIWIENNLYTRVIENHIEFLVKMKPSAIIKKSLIFYGNSYKLATFFSRESIGHLHKLPLMISHDFGVPLIMMPTLSAESEGNIWISFSAIDSYSINSHNQCLVHFTNSQVLPVNVSYSTMCRQFVLSHFLTNRFQKTRDQMNHPFSQSKLTYLPTRKNPKR
ncbi:competence protein ComK [Paenisporosarcina quisquiliarum]|uniref:Competence protein ComK n=1 Tax=Paenisporosarcina quisquiliarum TaxID=365346 RepID=A0A9X3LI17_9BACL|nr:competence protein ComK [Paenisporosarcina quisquiliarum]MCZ8537514.1 competence protein ComK [Paenisporosarcina quisquiliarum]